MRVRRSVRRLPDMDMNRRDGESGGSLPLTAGATVLGSSDSNTGVLPESGQSSLQEAGCCDSGSISTLLQSSGARG